MSTNLWPLSRRAKAPHVLVIDDFVPGTRAPARMPRQAELLRALAAAGAQVTVLPTRGTFVREPDGFASLRIRDRDDLGHVLSAHRERFAGIVVTSPHNMEMLVDIVARDPTVTGDALIVYDVAKPPPARELACTDMADIVLALDAATAAVFTASGHVDARVLGHAVAPRPGAPFPQRSGFVLLAPSYGEDAPAADRMRAFATDVAPLLRRQLGPVPLTLVAHDAAWIDPSLRSAVSMRPPADLESVFAAARVFVAPWCEEDSLPLDIYDAAGHGLPIVCPPGVAGRIGWRHGREILLAQSPREMAAACVTLHREQNLWEGLRAVVLARIGEDCARARFDAVIRDIVAQAHRRSGRR